MAACRVRDGPVAIVALFQPVDIGQDRHPVHCLPAPLGQQRGTYQRHVKKLDRGDLIQLARVHRSPEELAEVNARNRQYWKTGKETP